MTSNCNVSIKALKLLVVDELDGIALLVALTLTLVTPRKPCQPHCIDKYRKTIMHTSLK